MENMQQNNIIVNLAMCPNDAKALILGRKLLTFANEKDFVEIIYNSIRLVTTHENPNRIKTSVQSLSDDLHEIRDLIKNIF